MVKRKGLPAMNELVLCSVERITPYAAWCKLHEYPGVEGMIHVSEVSGKWVHDIREFVKQGKQYVAKVVRVEEGKGFINLSLKRVSKRDEKEKMNVFRREQRAEKMLEQAARELNKSLDQAYEEVGYLLQENFGELFVAFEEVRKSKENLLKRGIPDKWVEAISKVAERNFQEKEFVIKADLELKSYAEDGIEKIRKVLLDLERKGVVVKYISAPKYRVELKGKDAKLTERKLIESLDEAVKNIKQFEGEGNFKMVK